MSASENAWFIRFIMVAQKLNTLILNTVLVLCVINQGRPLKQVNNFKSSPGIYCVLYQEPLHHHLHP